MPYAMGGGGEFNPRAHAETRLWSVHLARLPSRRSLIERFKLTVEAPERGAGHHVDRLFEARDGPAGIEVLKPRVTEVA